MPQFDQMNQKDTRPTTAQNSFFCSWLLSVLLISFRNSVLKASDTCKPKDFSWYNTFSCAAFAEWERPCCCFCFSNEMPSDLFMNYLFGTAPLCSVHFFILSGVMSLSDCWCNSLSSRVCPHLLWAFREGYIYLGMSPGVLEVGLTH